jgi:uncharacterized protein (DUF305 family)
MESTTDAQPVDLSELSFDQLLELQRRLDASEHGGDGGGDGDGDSGGDGDGGGGDEIVVLTMLVTATLIAGMIGWMIGDNVGRAPHNQVDTGFLQDMRLHHEQALDISRRYLSTPQPDPGLAIIANSIIQGQTIEIGRMIQMLRFFGESESNEGETSMGWMNMASEVGQMEGMATDDQLDQLSAATDADADRLFVELMTAHHRGGVHMAEYAAANAASTEVRLMAESIVSSQLGEIAEMERELARA